METVITIQGMAAVKNEKAPRVFETNQGRFRVWPTINDGDPNPIAGMFQNGILDSFKITYTEKPWTNNDGRTFQQRYVETAERATPEDVAQSVEANAMQTAGNASASAVTAAGTQHTQAQASGSPDATQNDDPRIVVNYQGEFRSPMMSWASEIVAGAMMSGKFEATDIALLTSQAVGAWEDVPGWLEKLRPYTTDTDEWTQTHERPITPTAQTAAHGLEDQPETPPLEAYE